MVVTTGSRVKGGRASVDKIDGFLKRNAGALVIV